MPSPKVLCYVTDRKAFAGPEQERAAEVLGVIRRAAAAGVDWVQIREKGLATRALLEWVEQAVAVAAGTATRIIVNDRLDVALAARAAGVHLGEESMPVGEVKRWLAAREGRHGFLAGVSCHSLAEAEAAARDGADYVFYGPVFATPSKTKFGPPQGVERLREVCRALPIPVLAIGGITAGNAAECFAAGAAGIAAIRLFQETAGLVALAARLRQIER